MPATVETTPVENGANTDKNTADSENQTNNTTPEADTKADNEQSDDASNTESSDTTQRNTLPGVPETKVVVESRDARATMIAEGETLNVTTGAGTQTVDTERIHMDVLSEKFTPPVSGSVVKVLGRPFVVILKGDGSMGNPLSREGGASDSGDITTFQLRLRYEPVDLAGYVRDDLKIFFWDSAKAQWVKIDNAWHDGVNDRFILNATELGVYVIGVER